MRALRSRAAHAAFEAVLPSLLAALANAADPERALAAVGNALVSGLPSAVNLFRLLEARPGLLPSWSCASSASPRPLADELARRAGLLDPLIDTDRARPAGHGRGSLAARMCSDGGLRRRSSTAIRGSWARLRFALGVQLVEAAHDPLEIAEALSPRGRGGDLRSRRGGERGVRATHGRIAGSDLLVLGLGRLGGGALTHASDLDLIYLFSGGHGRRAAQSDGARPLSATHYFNRLAQRVTAALSRADRRRARFTKSTPGCGRKATQGPLAVTDRQLRALPG